MIFNMTGGMPLNFKVKAYASESELPATAAENTIAVITTTAISGYQFSSEQPSSPVNGFVWIQTSTSSTNAFDATKKNPIVVYPTAAKQYVSGNWVTKTAKSYINGKWNAWVRYLYEKGVQNVAWKPKTELYNVSGWDCLEPDFNSTNIYLQGGSSENDTCVCGVVTSAKVSLAGFTKLTVKLSAMENISDLSTLYVQITSRQDDTWDANFAVAFTEATESSSTSVIELPFNTSGSYYISIFTMRRATATITEVYLS